MHILRDLKIIFILLLIICLFMLMPVITAFYYNETSLIEYFLIPVGLIIAGAAFLFIITRKHKVKAFSAKDGFFFVSTSWVLASLFGCLPFYLSGTIPSFVDAFFETMSGYTTTGASILTEIESLPKCMLFWRSLTHWLGGMGIVVLTVAILPFFGIGGVHLIRSESPGPTVSKFTSRIAGTAKILWLIYLGLTIAETALLMISGMDLFDALTHTFGTLATGGFSPKNKSVGHYDSPYIHIIITIFMLLAGMNFLLFYKLITRKVKEVYNNLEFKVYIGIFIIAALIIALNLMYYETFPGFKDSLRYAGFQAASILTTTGFSTADFAAWPELSKIMLFFLMFVGGCGGSTGGGIKVIRIVVMFKLGIHEMKYLLHPRGVFSMKIDNTHVKKDVVYPIAGFFFLYFLLLLLVMIVVASGGNGIKTSISTALVTLGNIGPGFGKIGPTLNYHFFPPYIKWVLAAAMMIGRLELYTVLVLLTSQFRKK